MKAWLPDPIERSAFQRWALLALVLHLVAAAFSAGWFSYDEHWQILEFANAILGRTPRSQLPWEYAAKARPSLQPWIYAGIDRIAGAAGVTNPFRVATIFRVVSALFAWAATMLAGIAVLRTMPVSPARRWIAPTLAVAWFIPYLHARTSSENASETAFLFGFALLLLNAGQGELAAGKALLIGLLFGLAFEFRYQTGLLVAGAMVWSAFVDRQRPVLLALLTAGVLIAIGSVTVADHSFYGVWTFAPWNYVRVNIVEHRANSFGTSPWWSYFAWLPERLAPPLSLVIIVGTLGGWWRFRQSLLTWSMVPFFAVHVLLAHKEPRFLFPLATMSLLMTVLFFSTVTVPRWGRVLGGVLLVENMVLLAGASLLPSQPVMPIYERIYALAKQPTQIYFKGVQPYRLADDMHMQFYAPGELTMTPVDDYVDLSRHVSHGPLWFIEKRFSFPPEVAGLAKKCVVDTTTLPAWARRLDFNGWVGRQPAWTLYRCSP